LRQCRNADAPLCTFPELNTATTTKVYSSHVQLSIQSDAIKPVA